MALSGVKFLKGLCLDWGFVRACRHARTDLGGCDLGRHPVDGQRVAFRNRDGRAKVCHASPRAANTISTPSATGSDWIFRANRVPSGSQRSRSAATGGMVGRCEAPTGPRFGWRELREGSLYDSGLKGGFVPIQIEKPLGTFDLRRLSCRQVGVEIDVNSKGAGRHAKACCCFYRM
jgi:hypothetical protein